MLEPDIVKFLYGFGFPFMSLEKTFKKFNPVGKFILATDMVTNIKLEFGKVFRTELDACNLMESLVLSNLDIIKQLEGKIILCGADHLVTGNLNNFFKEDFDIGIDIQT